MNPLALVLAAALATILHFVWYRIAFATAVTASNPAYAKPSAGKTVLQYLVIFLLSFLVAVNLNFLVVHQSHLASIVQNDPGLKDPNSEVSQWLKMSQEKYGNNFRTFKHGTLHGLITAVTFLSGILVLTGIAEGNKVKLRLIHWGFWILSATLMGGIICFMK